MNGTLLLEAIDCLRHMLGVDYSSPRNTWGYRNYFDSSDTDMPKMELLVQLGLAEGPQSGSWFRATPDGCRLVGLPAKKITDMFRPKDAHDRPVT